jgi:hypothetical protein
MTDVYWELVDAFFGPAALQTSLHVMMTSVTCVDFFAHVCTSMMTHPVSFGFTEHGVQPVRAQPDLVIPYSAMSRRQLELAALACAEMDRSGRFVSSTMLGSGFFMQSLDSDKHYVPHTAVVGAAQALLERMNTPPAVRDVLMSRLVGFATPAHAPAMAETETEAASP